MAETLKFAYIVIFFVSLFIIVVVGLKECDTDEDCAKLYVDDIPKLLKCVEERCYEYTFIPDFIIDF
ncbi:unnamed protein product [Trifolium pratense]|uniref:Uncharacterized protein n=1 Tax=Trifolium pratense TaxID=57577 RepID=A0ACB0LKQ5_TRIPR|nr:unnamed protein product [Trifolium pratense]